MSLKNETFALLANHDLQDIFETMSLLIERHQLTRLASGKGRNEDVEKILHHLELAADSAEKIEQLFG
jgi:hypothetical protein